jgi:hypothetical protein
MPDQVTSSLANVIMKRKCALFAGAGLTRESGGATWKELIDFLKSEFSYSSPLIDEFQIISDMCRIYGKDAVYEKVKKKLKDATIDKDYIKLTSPTRDQRASSLLQEAPHRFSKIRSSQRHQEMSPPRQPHLHRPLSCPRDSPRDS